MRFLRQNTAVIITVGPFYDKTDGVTIETGLTITNEKITLTADTDDGSAPTNILDNVTGATSGSDNDLNYISGNDAGYMQMELTAANTNRVGRMSLSVTDAANHVPVFHEFFVLPQAIYDWFTGVTTYLPTNVTQISGDATAADNAESFFDGTGYAGTNNVIPTVTTVNGLAAGVITATAIANGAIDAATFAADVDAEILSYLVDDATRIDASALNTAAVTSVPAILADTGTDGVVVAAGSKTGYSLTATTGLGNQTANITGNLSGSVGSVTGAVGSVTGAVGSVTAEVSANVTKISGDADAADNAESFFDGTGYAGTNNVIPTVTTLTGHTAQTGDTFALANGVAGFVAINADVEAILADTGELQTNQGDWATATGFSTHSAADVVTALDDGATLTTCATATGFSTHDAADVKTALEASGSLLWKAFSIVNNKMNVTDADGTVALRNVGDTGTIATGSVTDDSTTTTRAELTWA